MHISPEKRKKRQNILSAIIHFTCIAIIVFLPEVVMSIGDTHRTNLPTGVYAKSILFIAVYYINYFFIVDKCFNSKHTSSKFILYNSIILIISLAITYFVWKCNAADKPITEYSAPHPMAPPPHHAHEVPHAPEVQPGDIRFMARTLSLFLRDAVMIILAMSLSMTIKLSSKWIKEKEHQQMLISAQREEELNSLKSQLNPHFLFNSLNSIYALIDVSPQRAKESVHELSHMLRYVLYETSSEVELKSELKFIKDYITLMKIRLGNKIPINVTLDVGDNPNLKIAPLIFITIIENVFKHGNTGNSEHQIDVSITTKNGVVSCSTFNHYNNNVLTNGNGIGLKNLKKRLNLIYGEKATLIINKTKDSFSVDLKIDLNK